MGYKERHIVGLDIGSTKVATLIAAVRESALVPIGIGLAESKGVKKGAVVNLEASVEAIKRSVGEAEAMHQQQKRCDRQWAEAGCNSALWRQFPFRE